MKNILKTSLASVAISFLLLFSACDNTAETFEITSPTAAVLSEIGITNLQLDANNTSNPALTLNWQEADYGQQVSVNYAIEFASDDTFTNPVVASVVTGVNTITLSTNEVNSAAGNAGLNPFEWATLHARVVSSLGTQSAIQSTSNNIQFSVYPYFNYVFNDYYLVGDSTAPGWNNNGNNPPLYRDANNSNTFYYTGYFSAGQFKVLEVKGLWQPQWGTNDGTTIDVNPGGGSDPGTFPNNNSPIATAGYYEFSVDFGTKTFSFQSFTETGSATYTTMSVQGSAAGGTTALNQLGHDQHIWYINNIHLVPGDVQFLTNTGALWASDTGFSGIATDGGASIPIVAEDDYDIWYNDLTGHYQLIPLNL